MGIFWEHSYEYRPKAVGNPRLPDTPNTPGWCPWSGHSTRQLVSTANGNSSLTLDTTVGRVPMPAHIPTHGNTSAIALEPTQCCPFAVFCHGVLYPSKLLLRSSFLTTFSSRQFCPICVGGVFPQIDGNMLSLQSGYWHKIWAFSPCCVFGEACC